MGYDIMLSITSKNIYKNNFLHLLITAMSSPSQKDVREVFGFNHFDVIFLIIMLLKHSAI
jgi:hypothetical protein